VLSGPQAEQEPELVQLHTLSPSFLSCVG